jgi:hypothetical protein
MRMKCPSVRIEPMMPSGPCFISGPRGYFSFEPSYSSQQTATLLGTIRGFYDKSTVYDSQGHTWHAKGIESPYKRSLWTILLANTVYNPRMTVSVLWREPKPYGLEDLKLVYSKAIDKDDDILTQFVEADELNKRISDAKSFDDLVAVYKWMKTDHTDGDPGAFAC